MCRTTVGINIGSVRLVVDHIGLGAKSVVHAFCDGKGAAVGTVQTDPHIFKGTGRQGDQMSDITVPACRIIHCASDVFFFCQRKFSHLAVYVGFDLFLYFRFHLMAFAVNDLDPVVIIRIMAGRDHDPTVKIFGPCHIGYAGSGRHVKKIGVRPGSGNSCRQRILKHIAASSGVLSDNDSGLMILPVVPSQISSYFKCMLHSQDFIGLTAKTICSKIFSHGLYFLHYLAYLPIFLHNQHSTLSLYSISTKYTTLFPESGKRVVSKLPINDGTDGCR